MSLRHQKECKIPAVIVITTLFGAKAHEQHATSSRSSLAYAMRSSRTLALYMQQNCAVALRTTARTGLRVWESAPLPYLDSLQNGHRCSFCSVAFIPQHPHLITEGGGMSLAMHNAAREGNVAELTKLLAQGSSVSTRDKHSRQPLHLSAWAGQLECCKVLVAEGADKGAAAMDDTTALHFAAQKGHAEIARFLLNEGSPVRFCAVT